MAMKWPGFARRLSPRRSLDDQMRLYFDTNSATEDGRYWLSLAGTVRDLKSLGAELRGACQ